MQASLHHPNQVSVRQQKDRDTIEFHVNRTIEGHIDDQVCFFVTEAEFESLVEKLAVLRAAGSHRSSETVEMGFGV